MSDHTLAPRAPSTNRLAAVAEGLAGALMPDGDEPCTWLVRVGPDPGRSSGERSTAPIAATPPEDGISLLPLDPITECPLDALVGLVAPDDWCALGVVATALARHVDRPGQHATAVLLVLLVDREGQSVSQVRRLDGGGSYAGMDVTAGPEGVLLDLCRRAFGLPTAPPDRSPMTWWAQLWLDAIVRETAVEPGRSWTWRDLMACHPLCDLLDPPDGPDGAGERGPDRFALAIEGLVAGYDWERLRRVGLAGPGRDLASWMDEGSFARWTLGLNPEVPDLFAALAALLSPEAIGSVMAVLDRWGELG